MVHTLKVWGMQKVQCVIWLECAGHHEHECAIKPVIYSLLSKSNYS
jgi:hypothetical protein